MAKAVIHRVETYGPFKERTILLGYEPTKNREIVRVLQQLEVVSPYEGMPTMEMELGMTYFNNGLRGFLWTTVEEKAGMTRVGWDSGKVVITESNKVVYYGPEIRRTEHFFRRLEHWAHIIKARIDNRPICPHCGRLLRIRCSENHQYYWYCEGAFLSDKHPWHARQWDDGLERALPTDTLKFLKDKRERTRKYNRMRIKQGKPKHGTARNKRKGWTKKHQQIAMP